MEFTPKTKKMMNKNEVYLLVDLIQSQPILTSKETNATANKLKEEAWVSLTADFNAKCGSIPRRKEQLKLKWDNLKKAARKRAQLIRRNNLKAHGGRPDFILRDEVLDRVTSLLGSKASSHSVPFDGDGRDAGAVIEIAAVHSIKCEEHYSDVPEVQVSEEIVLAPHTVSEIAAVPSIKLEEHYRDAPAKDQVSEEMVLSPNIVLEVAAEKTINLEEHYSDASSKFQVSEEMVLSPNTLSGRKWKDGLGHGDYERRPKFVNDIPLKSSKAFHRKGRRYIDDGRRELNLALAKYYTKKAEKLELEIMLLKEKAETVTENSKN